MVVLSPKTVGRGKPQIEHEHNCSGNISLPNVSIANGDSLHAYSKWAEPTVIVSDGGYGILGFDGDTSSHKTLPDWYEPHIREWSRFATGQTTLWFWNTEVGWASVHPLLERYGWKFVGCNIWDKGIAHIAGNVNTQRIRKFPVVSEVCAHYVFEPKINGMSLKEWLKSEWKRTGLPLKEANLACGVKDAAVRKYLDQGHLWYFPPADAFEQMAQYANKNGNKSGQPYFSVDLKRPLTGAEWEKFRAKFKCPHAQTNIWHRQSLKGSERIKASELGVKAAHLNQKPLDLMKLIIEASSDVGDVIWEPFGGLFSASLAGYKLGRKVYSCEIDKDYFSLGVNRFKESSLDLFD